MDILITAAGKSSRFGGEAKFLIDVLGYPMLHWALKSLDLSSKPNVYIALSSEDHRSRVERIARNLRINLRVLNVGPTTGQGHTVSLALEQFTPSKDGFLVVPVDTVLREPLDLRAMEGNSILSFPSDDFASFSFVSFSRSEEGRRRKVGSIVEKSAGDLATAGYYSFDSRETFLRGWERVSRNREDYISHVYQELIDLGEEIFSVETEASRVIDLGTPAKLRDGLDSVFGMLLDGLPANVFHSNEEIKEFFRANDFHEHNREVLGALEAIEDRSFPEEVGYGALVHDYNAKAKSINSLLREDDLSWLTFFLYDSKHTEYSLWKYLESRKGAKLFIIEDSEEILYKVPHKRQVIIDHFREQGKRFVCFFDDDIYLKIAFKTRENKTPLARRMRLALALKIMGWIAVENDPNFLYVGPNPRRMQYARAKPLEVLPAVVWWNLFFAKLSFIDEHELHFVTDAEVHEDLCFAADMALLTDYLFLFFLVQEPTYDFNLEAMARRHPATEAHSDLWKIKDVELPVGISKNFGIDSKRLLAKREEFGAMIESFPAPRLVGDPLEAPEGSQPSSL